MDIRQMERRYRPYWDWLEATLCEFCYLENAHRLYQPGHDTVGEGFLMTQRTLSVCNQCAERIRRDPRTVAMESVDE